MSKIFDFVKPGVITGDDVQKVFQVAKENNFALPAVNCVGTDSINAVLEAAAKVYRSHASGRQASTNRSIHIRVRSARARHAPRR